MSHRFIMILFLSLFPSFWHTEDVVLKEARHCCHIDNAQPVPRGSHADYLPENAISRVGTLCLRQSDSTIAVAYSPDGKTLASRTDEGSIRLWDAGTGNELWAHHFFEAPGALGGQVTFSPDGKQMATVGREGVHLWNLDTKYSTLLSKASIPISFSPDSKLAVGASVRDLVIFDLKTCSVKVSLARIRSICTVAFSPDGELVATWEKPFSNENPSLIRLWDVRTGKQAGELVSKQRFIKSLNFSPDGKLLVSADPNKGVCPCLWNVAMRKEMATIEHPSASLAVFSPTGKLLATSDNTRIRLWDTSTWKEVRTLNSFASIARWRSLAFSPDGKKVLAAGNSNALELWEVETGIEVFPSLGHRFAIHSLQFSSDGNILASQDFSRTVCLWNAAGKSELHRLPIEKNVWTGRRYEEKQGYSLAISPDAKALATYLTGIDKSKPSFTVGFWDIASGDKLFDLLAPPSPGSISFSPDGGILATAYNGVGFRFWSISSCKLVREISDKEHSPVGRIVFAPDGRTFATTGRKQIKSSGSKNEFIPVILLWDWRNGRLIRDFPSQKHETHLTFSSGGQMLASCFYAAIPNHKDDAIRLWEPPTGTVIQTLEGKHSTASCVAFSPNGRLLASACPTDHSVRIWDVFTGKELAKFTGHRGPVYCVAFSPDGKTVASGSADTTILLWDVSKIQPEQPPSMPRNELPKEVARLWEQMQGKDGAKAYQAIWRLIGAGDDAVAFLGRKLHPVSAPDAKLLDQAIAELNSEDFSKRETGTAHLAKLGELAEPALRQALQNKPSLEVRKRIENLLASLAERPFHELELHQIRDLHALELIGSPAAIEVFKKLANGAAGARLTSDAKLALKRLERRAIKP